MSLFSFSFHKGDATSKPVKKVKAPKGSNINSLHKSLKVNKSKCLTGVVDFREAVKVPAGEDANEWVATNAIDIFNTVSLIWENLVSDTCTERTCPVMNAGPAFEYLWQDGPKKKPVKIPAREYVERLFEWCRGLFGDEEVFPMEGAFGKKFRPTVKTMLKRLFRVYAHIYKVHWDSIKELSSEKEFYTCFKHYYYFVQEFGLVSSSDMKPLATLLSNIDSI
mmetsp:Transcript_18608/g.47288  ORF Transcript_18608/g.47288 Transcript_18608/m.47288 type:complete len:222 (-) Transcript_18608:119-784(-)